jgi:hypothetical protein
MALSPHCASPRRYLFHFLAKEKQKSYNALWRRREMSGKSSFPYRKYDRKPHPHIVKQILDDDELIEMMKEVLIQEGRACPFCHRKLKGEPKVREIW